MGMDVVYSSGMQRLWRLISTHSDCNLGMRVTVASLEFRGAEQEKVGLWAPPGRTVLALQSRTFSYLHWMTTEVKLGSGVAHSSVALSLLWHQKTPLILFLKTQVWIVISALLRGVWAHTRQCLCTWCQDVLLLRRVQMTSQPPWMLLMKAQGTP